MRKCIPISVEVDDGVCAGGDGGLEVRLRRYRDYFRHVHSLKDKGSGRRPEVFAKAEMHLRCDFRECFSGHVDA